MQKLAGLSFFFLSVATVVKHAHLYPEAPRTSAYDNKGTDS